MKVRINASPSDRNDYPGYTHGAEGETGGKAHATPDRGPQIVVTLDSGSVIHYPAHMVQPIE